MWAPTTTYEQGYKVVQAGYIYQAKWYNIGNDPAAHVQFAYQTPWELPGPVLPGDLPWVPSRPRHCRCASTRSFAEPASIEPGPRVSAPARCSDGRVASTLGALEGDALVSQTTRLSAGAEVLGVWEAQERRIVIRQDRLQSASHFLGTFLHELTHATSGFPDLSTAFETALTERLGTVTAAALNLR